MERRKYTKKDFKWVNWTPKDINRISREIIVAKKKAYKKIKQIKVQDRTFENTIIAIESSDYDDLPNMHRMGLLKNVHPKSDVRLHALKAIIKLDKAFTDIEYDEEMYKAVQSVKAKKEKLKDEDKKLFSDMLRGYKRMGFGLPKAARKKIQKNSKLLSQYENQFEKNINDYEDHILLNKDELGGLPENFVKGLARSKSGKYKVSLDYPDIGPFLQHSDNAKKRELLAHKNLKKGGARNAVLLQKMISLRKENAKLLGYRNHVDYKVEVRMAKRDTIVKKFLEDLIHKTERKIEKDLIRLENAKKKHTKNKSVKILYFDVAYYANILRKEKYNIDPEKVREYFPFKQVMKGTFLIYSKLFSVKFKRVTQVPLWHKDAELYEVRNLDGSIRSYFMLDLFPRHGKYGHACAVDVVPGYLKPNGTYNTPMACMIANFNKSRKGVPSLLSHNEVETFFHEFGHIMHYVLTTAEHASQSGFNTTWDFVEAPSQMLENWVWESAPLKKLSRHYKTRAPFPKSMLDSLIKAKQFMVIYNTMRQLILSYTDFLIHTKYPKDPNALYRTLVKKYVHIDIPKDNLYCAGWGHLSEYDGGYYGYLWALVYAADMFTRFKKEGVLNARVGRDYKEMILEKGGSADEYEMVKDFLGRKPNNKAFLKEIGL
ncbi:Zn-dependent oligopeptidase [Patescibacteria group bacterium]|nr:Zn-dependent oligopeptidase [Patescibacteria group bacterium]